MRRTIKLMNNWLFTDMSGTQTELNLPHTWNAIDGQDGGGDYKRGTCSYQKELKAPEFDRKTELVYLQFHGVNASASVVLNGKEIMTHDGGYSTFRVNITEALKDVNDLVVKVDNSKNRCVYPQRADFTFYGGIYRDVEFLIIPKEHFDVDYFGSNGIKVTPTVKDGIGNLQVETFIKVEQEANVEVEVLDAEGMTVVAGNGTNVALSIPNVHLWNGRKDPYLYRVIARLMREGEEVDKVETTCGFRFFRFDAKEGFFLNGKKYPLHGVCRHQDRKAIGNAITYEMMEEDMELIKEVGATAIRLPHYQHNQYFYDLCDKEGMIVWTEIPYISEHMPQGRANTFSQMRELIIQNYNHPCVVMWGLSNEITISPKHRRDMLDNHRKLQKFVKEMDATRVTTLACYAVCSPFHPVSRISDIVGWNLYLGWYVPFLWLNDAWIWFYHLLYPKRCLSYSEYGAEGMPNLHSEKPKRGDNTEEYMNKYHEYMLECFKRHPYMWGTYVWNMFDFAADERDQGGEPGMNHKGLITFDHKIKKDSFYLYKAYWNKEDAFVYLAGKRFKYRKSKKQVITVYSNQKEVSLYHNGKRVETKIGENVFKFEITLTDGKNRIGVKSGELTDTAIIYRTNKPHPEYRVKKKDTKNWM